MDKPIAVGDLVMVVKPELCCGNKADIGRIFIVAEIGDKSYCWECGAEVEIPCAFVGLDDDADGFSLPLLKRIPPISELESINTQEKMEA